MKKSDKSNAFHLVLMWAAQTLALCPFVLAAEMARGGDRPDVKADRDRGEVRIPAWFVNPSRKLEVFASHESGPIHESVLAFEAEGDQLDRALREIGFRGPDFWNATSPHDLRWTGGDRAVVWVRWEWKGQTHELPAEEMLIEETTRLPLFLRGFSFTSQPVLQGDPPRKRIPRAVELTIGGASRQSAAFSLLYHPNDLEELLPWCPGPELDARSVPDLAALVEARTPCLLIIRRIKSESELIELASVREKDEARRSVRERQRPLAAAIDARKREFEQLVGEVKGVLSEGEGHAELSEADRKKYASRLHSLVSRAKRIAAEVRETYLRLWSLEEESRLAEVKGMPAMDRFQRALAVISYRSGFKFEVEIAGLRRQIAEIEEGRQDAPGDPDGLVRRALEAEIRKLELERERRWARFKLEEEVRPRLAELDPKKDDYTYQLFREDELRILADLRLLSARVEETNANVLDLRGRSKGSLGPMAEGLARYRRCFEARARLAEAELLQVELMEKVRWAKNPPGGLAEPDRKELSRLAKEVADAAARAGELRKALEQTEGAPVRAGDTPPVDWSGKPLAFERLEA